MAVHGTAAHVEQHFTGSETIRDIVIGMSDGLTVPFALAAGLAGAVTDHLLIVIAGFAELAAGSIAMGMGGFMAARSDADSYRSELRREQREIVDLPDRERQEVRDIFAGYGLTGHALEGAVDAITSNPDAWLQFMMREELGLEEPNPNRALSSSLTIGGSYVAAGVLPLIPYFFPIPIHAALLVSALVTLVALGVFGWFKGQFTGISAARSAGNMMLVGGLAAAAAFIIASLISGIGG